ncbi:MAG: hypothetical protein ABFD29_00230 [Anaerolineaceae bacterium]
MDIEQIAQRLEWLDDERRKDKLTIATLEDRLARLEGKIPTFDQEIRESTDTLNRITSNLSRFDQLENSISQMKVEYNRLVENEQKLRSEKERDIEKVRLADLESLNRSIQEVRKGLDPIPELKKNIQARTEEEHRLSKLIAESEKKILETKRFDDEYRRSLKVIEETLRQESKRQMDLQGEVSSIRKRVEEQRGKVDLISESVRKIEMKQNEFSASEIERRQVQTAFIERQNMAQVERDRIWKEWQTRFDSIEDQSSALETQLQSLDAAERSIKHAQEAFEEITQRFERRINEISEMQRLVEDRFKQDWNAFKTDDQKRWTNYTITQDEKLRENSQLFEKMTERLVALEDITQEVQDLLQMVIAEEKSRLDIELQKSRETMENFERTFGRATK